jgi:hypothetical protein
MPNMLKLEYDREGFGKDLECLSYWHPVGTKLPIPPHTEEKKKLFKTTGSQT